MALQLISCPHCRMDREMESEAHAPFGTDRSYFLFVCPSCNKPVVLLAQADNPPYEYRRSYDVEVASQSFKKCGWSVVDTWPKAQFRKETAPDGVPEPIGTLFEQSQEAASGGAYDLAIMGFRRVLKMVQSELSPGSRAETHSWILSLIESKDLTRDMSDWAARLKGLRREIEGADVKQAEEFAVFVHILLEQIFGVRSRLARLRKSGAP